MSPAELYPQARATPHVRRRRIDIAAEPNSHTQKNAALLCFPCARRAALYSSSDESGPPSRTPASASLSATASWMPDRAGCRDHDGSSDAAGDAASGRTPAPQRRVQHRRAASCGEPRAGLAAQRLGLSLIRPNQRFAEELRVATCKTSISTHQDRVAHYSGLLGRRRRASVA